MARKILFLIPVMVLLSVSAASAAYACAGLSAGGQHTCALLNNGNVACWGANSEGQSNPYNGGDAIGVSAGGWHTCALLNNGNITCWGWNSVGQSNPYNGGDAIEVFAGGWHTCALLRNGNVACWGRNDQGQSNPYNGGDAIGVSAGFFHTCALLNNGNVTCWGYNYFGQSNPYNGGDAIGVSAKGHHTCALLNNGNVTCWGYNDYGQSNPYNGGDEIGVSAGGYHTCALLDNGNVACWGWNVFGQSNPYNGGDAIGVSAGVYHTCALLNNGNVHCWGWNNGGQSNPYNGGNAVCSIPIPSGSKAIKESSLAALQSLTSSNAKAQKEINKAIGHLQKSLTDQKITWIDDSHIACKHGNSVFDEEKEAVKNLMKVSNPKHKDTYDASIKPAIDDMITKIADADKLLASTLISEANALTKKDLKEIADANREIMKAEEDRTAGDFDKAIDGYKKGWQHAKKASYQDTGCDYCDLDWEDTTATCGDVKPSLPLTGAAVSVHQTDFSKWLFSFLRSIGF